MSPISTFQFHGIFGKYFICFITLSYLRLPQAPYMSTPIYLASSWAYCRRPFLEREKVNIWTKKRKYKIQINIFEKEIINIWPNYHHVQRINKWVTSQSFTTYKPSAAIRHKPSNLLRLICSIVFLKRAEVHVTQFENICSIVFWKGYNLTLVAT